MELVSVDDRASQESAGRLELSDPLGTTDFAINHYSLEPGERFSGGLHTHMDQEEAFFVVSGTATFEYTDEPLGTTETVEVAPDAAVRFAPGEYQTGYNDGEEPVEALAFGAPRGGEDERIPGPCPACEHEWLQLTFEDNGVGAVCPDCGAEPDIDG